MALPLGQLIESIQYTDIQLLAGEDNLVQPVKWVHAVETLEAIDFIAAGELVICTGVGITDTEVFLRMIQLLIKKKAAGFIANIGPFIKEVPDAIVEYCIEKQFPLFTLPWRIHLAEIVQLFCMSITRSEQDEMELSAAIKNAFLFPMQENLYLPKLLEKRLKTDASYQIGILSCRGKGDLLLEFLSKYWIMNHKKSVFCFPFDDRIIMLLSGEAIINLKDFMNSLLQILSKFEKDSDATACYLGIGRPVDSLTKLYISYQSADKIVTLQEKGLLTEEQIYYSDLGVYSVLANISDVSVLKEYAQNLISSLLDYDKTTGNTLSEVLYYYLSHNGSVKDTAEHFFVHRNTINYKLNKAERILEMDLSDWNNRYQLMLAFQCFYLCS